MISYCLTRLSYYLTVFLGIVVFSFLLFHIVPADPARTILGPLADERQVEQLREQLGLDRPLPVQFFRHLGGIARLDFGRSHVDGRDVLQEVVKRSKVTFALLAVTTLILFSYLLASVWAFLSPTILRWQERVEFLMSSLPIFFSGVIVALLVLHFSPVTSFSGRVQSPGDLLYLFPPALVLAFYPMAILSTILRNEMGAALRSPYVTAARAWGFSQRGILFRDALKNVLIPVLSALSNILPVLVTGAFIVEIIFSVPGIGTLLIKSILERDFPMLECTVIMNGAFFVILNLGFEYLYPVVDPRIARK